MASSLGKGLPQRYRLPAIAISAARHRHGGGAHSTARWIHAADLSGGRCEFERHRLMRIMTERYERPLLDRPARKASLSFKADGGDAFCLLQPPSGECPHLTHKVALSIASLPMATAPCSLVLPSNSLFRERRPFTSTMAGP